MNDYEDEPNGAYFRDKFGITEKQYKREKRARESHFITWLSSQPDKTDSKRMFDAYEAGIEYQRLREVNY